MKTILNLHGIFPDLSRVSELIQIGEHTLTIYYNTEETPLVNVKFICKFFRFDPVQDGDIHIEIRNPEGFPLTPGRKYENDEDIRKRAEKAKKMELENTDLDAASLSLFATAYDRLKLTLPDIDIIRSLSATIAKCCLSKSIKAEHLAEAIHYKTTAEPREKFTKYLVEL